tara:strand:+ start:626 stop:1297 length:672 start_codon:yes stop_codon:yes gene_type:complete
MHQRKSKIILLYFFLLVIVSSIGNYSINNFKLSEIPNIKISGLDLKDNQILLSKLNNLNIENIFYINKDEIKKLLNSNSLIESYEVFKKYPSTLNINIKKTNFLAKINKDRKIFLIGSNGKLTPDKKAHNSLPYIFGKPNIEEFLKFKKILDNSKFSYNQIENLFFFPSKRWDIELKENILLKLPNDLTYESLDILHEFIENYNGEDFIIVDSRIKNQIILNE